MLNQDTNKPIRITREILKANIDHPQPDAQAREDRVPSGLRDLDHVIGGFQKGNLSIIAGSHAMGKTTLALNIAAHAALEKKKTVVLFSPSESREQIVQKLLCAQARISSHVLRKGSPHPEDTAKLEAATARLSAASIYLDAECLSPFPKIRAACRRLKKTSGLDMAILDDAHLLPGLIVKDRRKALIALSRALKDIAVELDIPVLAISHLSGAVDKRRGGEPKLSDLPMDAALAERASLVLLLHREEMYSQETEMESEPEQGRVEIIVARNRGGVYGAVPAFLSAHYGVFLDYTGRGLREAEGNPETLKSIEQFAREEALRLGHSSVRTEHLLLGLIRENGPAVRALEARGVNVAELALETERSIPDEDGRAAIARRIPLDARVRDVMVDALMVGVERTGRPELNSGDVLVALMSEGKSAVTTGVDEASMHKSNYGF